MTDDLNPGDLPWETAPEMAAEFADELGCSDAVREEAVRIATDHGLNGDLGATPRVIAASAVYLTSLLHNEKLTQPEVCEASGVSDAAVRKNYQLLAELEGIGTGGSADSDDQGSGEPPESSFQVAEVSETDSEAIQPAEKKFSLSWGRLLKWGVPLAVVGGICLAFGPIVFNTVSAEAFAEASKDVVTPSNPGSATLLVVGGIMLLSTAVVSYIDRIWLTGEM